MKYLVFEATIMKLIEPMSEARYGLSIQRLATAFLQSPNQLDGKRRPLARRPRRLDLEQSCQAIQLISVEPISDGVTMPPGAFSPLLSVVGTFPLMASFLS